MAAVTFLVVSVGNEVLFDLFLIAVLVFDGDFLLAEVDFDVITTDADVATLSGIFGAIFLGAFAFLILF